jgi:hypothetical protein
MQARFFSLIFFCWIVVFTPNSFSQTAGAIPRDVNPKDIHVIIKKFDKSGWSLRVGDRRIKGTDFVVSDWANTDDYTVALGGVLGVFIEDLSAENKLESQVESILKNDFNLQALLKSKLKSDESFNELVGGIGTTSVKSHYRLVLKPYSLIYSNADGLIFNPQILAELFNKNNKSIWTSVYGESSVRRKWNGGSNSWDRVSVDKMLNEIFELMILHIKANMNGFDNAYQKDRDEKLTEKFMENIEITLPEL